MTQEITHIPNSIHGLRQTAMKFATQAANAKRRLAKMGEENSKTMDGVVNIVEVVGAAFAIATSTGSMGRPRRAPRPRSPASTPTSSPPAFARARRCST